MFGKLVSGVVNWLTGFFLVFLHAYCFLVCSVNWFVILIHFFGCFACGFLQPSIGCRSTVGWLVIWLFVLIACSVGRSVGRQSVIRRSSVGRLVDLWIDPCTTNLVVAHLYKYGMTLEKL